MWKASIALLISVMTLPGDALAREGAQGASDAMHRLTPSLARDADTILFGDMWKRPQLSPRDRSLVTVAILIATNKSAQLGPELERALDNGVKPVEIGGLIGHLAFYTGFPNAESALDVADRIFAARHISAAQLRPSSDKLSPPSPGDDAVKQGVQEQLAVNAPKFVEVTIKLIDDMWRRPELAPRDRSLITIAALAAIGERSSLGYHVERGLGLGLTETQIFEALTQMGFYAGWPRAYGSIWGVSQALAKRKEGTGGGH